MTTTACGGWSTSRKWTPGWPLPYPRGGDCRLLDLLAEAGVLRGTASQPEHQLTAALTEFLVSGAHRSIEHQLEVTVRLSRWRPATWRRVLIPATDNLGTLAWTIAVLFGWGFDHLHVFDVGPQGRTRRCGTEDPHP